MVNVYLMSLKQVCAAIGFKKTTVYKWINEGTFPPPVRIGSRVRWPSNEIEAWIREHISSRDKNP